MFFGRIQLNFGSFVCCVWKFLYRAAVKQKIKYILKEAIFLLEAIVFNRDEINKNYLLVHQDVSKM